MRHPLTPWLAPATALALLAAQPASAETVIGVAAPLSGPTAPLGRQVLEGAQAAALAKGDIRIVSADDACTAEGGRAAALAFVAAEPQAVVGFLCTEAVEAALPVLKDAGIPVLALGVRTDSLTDRRDRTGWPVARLGPRADAEREAASSLIPRLWRDAPFAIVDDGTIYGRELAESVRAGAEALGLKPVFVDTYRPGSENQVALVGRLRRAGAVHAFVGGDRQDIATMARDAAATDAAISFAGGEALRSEPGPVPLSANTLMVGLPEPAERAPAELLATLREGGRLVEGYFLPAYAAVEIAASRPADAPEDFAGQSFQTAIGQLAFDAKGDLAQNPFRLFRFDGTTFIELPAP